MNAALDPEIRDLLDAIVSYLDIPLASLEAGAAGDRAETRLRRDRCAYTRGVLMAIQESGSVQGGRAFREDMAEHPVTYEPYQPADEVPACSEDGAGW